MVMVTVDIACLAAARGALEEICLAPGASLRLKLGLNPSAD